MSLDTIAEVDHLDSMRGRWPVHIAGAPNLDALISAVASQYQDIETAMIGLLTLRSLDTASGAQLDGLGQIVDLVRVSGQTDADYRFALLTQMIVLSKSGDVESIIQAYLRVMGAATAEYSEVYPATVQIAAIPSVDVTDSAVAAFISATMQRVKAAGVNLILTTTGGFTLAQTSEVDGSGNGPSDSEHGFGSNTGGQNDGGGLARAF
jgi:hypothetical protein